MLFVYLFYDSVTNRGLTPNSLLGDLPSGFHLLDLVHLGSNSSPEPSACDLVAARHGLEAAVTYHNLQEVFALPSMAHLVQQRRAPLCALARGLEARISSANGYCSRLKLYALA